ncbi:MAG: galactokinase [Eubacteriaceae bacterium]|jgi:galactokinase
MEIAEIREKLSTGGYNDRLAEVYGQGHVAEQSGRYLDIIDEFEKRYPDNPGTGAALYSAPGRTEIGGNHTDHQQGSVLAGSVSLDAAACAAPNNTDVVRIYSQGYPTLYVDLNDLKPDKREYNTTSALIRGVAAGFIDKCYPVQGFDAVIYSTVLGGSGLSSSAAFEVLIGVIINDLFCEGKESPESIAKIGQDAENKFFGKPCGLMDQMASSVGGIIGIDFEDPKEPKIRKIHFDLPNAGYELCIIDSHSGHADLTDQYASIPEEMKEVAGYFGKSHLKEVPEAAFWESITVLRKQFGDRAVLRAAHFFNETKRAELEADALENGEFEYFLKLVQDSGNSSAQFLQNVVPEGSVKDQSINIVLALCDRLLGDRGACRVHGGGFAGTVQAFVPDTMVEKFRKGIDSVLGEGSCHVLTIRQQGGIVL